MQRFEVPGVSNYTTLLLSPDSGTLYLGAREMLIAVNTSHFHPGAPARRVSPRTGAESCMGQQSPWAGLGLGCPCRSKGDTKPALVSRAERCSGPATVCLAALLGWAGH